MRKQECFSIMKDGNVVYRLRLKLGMTEQDFSKVIGVPSAARVQLVESSRRQPSAEYLLRIFRYCRDHGIPLDIGFLLDGEGAKGPSAAEPLYPPAA